jgi:hypothetical protein
LTCFFRDCGSDIAQAGGGQLEVCSFTHFVVNCTDTWSFFSEWFSSNVDFHRKSLCEYFYHYMDHQLLTYNTCHTDIQCSMCILTRSVRGWVSSIKTNLFVWLGKVTGTGQRRPEGFLNVRETRSTRGTSSMHGMAQKAA